jgi:flagellar protein FlgJ
MTKDEFLFLATAAARNCSTWSNLPPGITVAQAALESAWGQSQLARAAHNYFGIKAHGAHPFITLPTREVVRGQSIRTAARFARYASLEECFADRDRLLCTSHLYADACACAHDPEAFARALAVHWATDPHYAEKLLAVWREHHLDVLIS